MGAEILLLVLGNYQLLSYQCLFSYYLNPRLFFYFKSLKFAFFQGWFFEDYVWYSVIDRDALDSYERHTYNFKLFGYTNPFVFGNAGDIIMLTLVFLVLYPLYYALFFFFMSRPRVCTSI